MSSCPHCNSSSNGGETTSKNPPSPIKWLGMYSHCDSCDKWHFRNWDLRSTAFIVVSVLLFQFMASLVVYPILDFIVGPQFLTVTLFTLFHLMCLPLYIMMSVTFMVNTR